MTDLQTMKAMLRRTKVEFTTWKVGPYVEHAHGPKFYATRLRVGEGHIYSVDMEFDRKGALVSMEGASYSS